VPTRLTIEILNRLIFALVALADQGMAPRVGDTVILTIFELTRLAIGVNPFGSST
jgi:hypothetical protein